MGESRSPVGKPDPLHADPLNRQLTPTFVWADLDQAKTLRRALEVLPDHLRLQWLNWCCEQASLGGPMNFRVMMIPKDLVEYLVNVWQLIGKGRLTMDSAVKSAEGLARKAW